MRYERPTERSDQEIILGLSNRESSQDARMSLVLSAIYYSTTKFAGDVLINELVEADYDNKFYVTNVVTSFYQMHSTTYRIDESISLLQVEKLRNPQFALQIEENIQELLERKAIFQQTDNQSR